MKTCTSCNLGLPLENFSRRGKGYQAKCKSCNQVYQRQHYLANKATYSAKAMEWKRVRKAEIRFYLLSVLSHESCVDCGVADPVVLQFDHKDPMLKEFSISNAIENCYAIPKISKEISKCDVRCANCHQRKTAHQFRWYRVT